MGLHSSTPILVVDPAEAVLRIIRGLLQQLGFEDVDDAADGAAALGMLVQKKYGLVICDFNTAPMTGYELLCQVRADANLRTIPFIMVSADTRIENVIAAKKAGVSNFLLKPFGAQTLKAKMAGLSG